MPVTIRTILISGLLVSLICLSTGHAEAARRRAILGTHVRAVPVRAVPVRAVPVRAVPVRAVPVPAAYRVATPVMVSATPRAMSRAMRRVVRYGRSDLVGPRGYAAVISPWPLIPVTTPSKPYGVGVVPPGQVIAWQSPTGYFYRANYQSPVMQIRPPVGYPRQPGVEVVPAEIIPPGTLEVPPEPIPAPPAESGPQF